MFTSSGSTGGRGGRGGRGRGGDAKTIISPNTSFGDIMSMYGAFIILLDYYLDTKPQANIIMQKGIVPCRRGFSGSFSIQR